MKTNHVKTGLVILALLACMCNAQAQGTFIFDINLSGGQEIPPNTSTAVSGGGAFLLGTRFYCDIGGYILVSDGFTPTSATINGPAGVGEDASTIFDLGTPRILIYSSGKLRYSFGVQTQNLTAGQISDLLAGQWYVNIKTADFPEGEIRGQIVPVPEPSSVALLALIGGGMFLWRKELRKNKLFLSFSPFQSAWKDKSKEDRDSAGVRFFATSQFKRLGFSSFLRRP